MQLFKKNNSEFFYLKKFFIAIIFISLLIKKINKFFNLFIYLFLLIIYLIILIRIYKLLKKELVSKLTQLYYTCKNL